jgi:hypothetical protein
MDTRRISGSNEAGEWPSGDAYAAEVEVVELRHVERPIRGLLARLVFVAGIAVLAGTIAIAGLPGRSSFSLNQPLPNLLAPATAP